MLTFPTCLLMLGSLLTIAAAPVEQEPPRDVRPKATYNFPAFPAGFEDKIRPKSAGCVLLIQGPSEQEEPVELERWKQVKRCEKVFPYCTAGQRQPPQLGEVARLINNVAPAWGGSILYVVQLQTLAGLKDTDKTADKIKGGNGSSMFVIDAQGNTKDLDWGTDAQKWGGADVECDNPYKFMIGEQGKFVYDL